LSVVITSFLAFLILNEAPIFWQYIGGVMTILGIILYNYFESQSTTEVNRT
jgi:drug/metabolite transporter (DMT)-like permease